MLFKLTSLAIMASILTSTHGAPAQENPQTNSCGKATADRKNQLLGMGAEVEDLAITIQETACEMSSSYSIQYPGDKNPDGTLKTLDSANYGLFKNNWGTIRMYCKEFSQFGPEDYQQGLRLNDDDQLAIDCLHEQKSHDDFWVKQRGGASPGGCGADPTGETYRNAIASITSFLNSGNTNNGDIIDPKVTAC